MGFLKNAFVTVVVLNGLAAIDVIQSFNEAEKAGKDPYVGFTDYSHYAKFFKSIETGNPTVDEPVGTVAFALLIPGIAAGVKIAKPNYK